VLESRIKTTERGAQTKSEVRVAAATVLGPSLPFRNCASANNWLDRSSLDALLVAGGWSDRPSCSDTTVRLCNCNRQMLSHASSYKA